MSGEMSLAGGRRVDVSPRGQNVLNEPPFTRTIKASAAGSSPLSAMRAPRPRPALAIAAALAVLAGALALPPTAAAPTGEEPGARDWLPFFLEHPSDRRLPPPPNEVDTLIELVEVQRLALRRSPGQVAAIEYWNDGPATVRWTEESLDIMGTSGLAPPAQARVLAMVHAAMYDATLAAWDTKYAYERVPPWKRDPLLTTVVEPRDNPSYPSEHAVAAGAAAEVLGALFPAKRAELDEKARIAAESRVWAGLHYPSDVAAGLELGREIGRIVLRERESDGATVGAAPWPHDPPAGACKWREAPDDPQRPLAVRWGDVRPWLIASAADYLPPPPPDCASAAYLADHYWVYEKSLTLTSHEKYLADYWGPGLANEGAAGVLNLAPLKWAREDGLSTPRAARAFAYVNIAIADAFTAAWHAKYVYWTERPVHVIRELWDATWTPYLPTPAFPGYPSGHATSAGVAGDVLGVLFPAHAAEADRLSREDAYSRELAGVHPKFDDDMGLRMGRLIAVEYVERAVSDGA